MLFSTSSQWPCAACSTALSQQRMRSIALLFFKTYIFLLTATMTCVRGCSRIPRRGRARCALVCRLCIDMSHSEDVLATKNAQRCTCTLGVVLQKLGAAEFHGVEHGNAHTHFPPRLPIPNVSVRGTVTLYTYTGISTPTQKPT